MAAAAYGLGWQLQPEQRLVGAIFALTVAAWITEALPLAVTALLSTSLLVLSGVAEEKKAFSAYGDPIILLFVGSFLLAKSMEISGLASRMAWWALSQRWASVSASRLVLVTGVVSCVISLFVSNTAVAAMLLPVVAGILASMGAQGTSFATAMMLMLTWGSSVAVGVPVGTPPNLIGMELIFRSTGRQISFLEWMAFGLPITAAMVVAAWLVLRMFDLRKAPPIQEARSHAESEYRALPTMSSSERNTVLAFLITLTLWVLPDTLALAWSAAGMDAPPAVGWLQKHVTPTIAALLGASLLFLLPARDKPSGRTLSWREGVTIDWGIVLLFGGGIALGQAMFDSGLAKVLGEAAAQATGADSLWAITALCIASSILLSELASNTAAATTIVPVAVGLAQGAGVSPIAPALGAALGASFGFMLPVSTPPNAIVYSSGQVTSGQMAKRGFLIDLIAFLVVLLGLRLILPPLGLA